jgi:hypothetical protein
VKGWLHQPPLLPPQGAVGDGQTVAEKGPERPERVGFVKSVQLRGLRVLVDEAAEYRSSFHPGVEIA